MNERLLFLIPANISRSSSFVVHTCPLYPCTHHINIPHAHLSMSANNTSGLTNKWQCIKGCGACCKLGEFDPDVIRQMLKNDNDVVEYLSMVGEDGWCKWLDTTERTCTKYLNRPRFCRATPDVFQQLYDIERNDFDDFAIECCHYHIDNIYGSASQEMDRFVVTTRVPYDHNH